MFASKEEIIKWTFLGLELGADYFFIVKDNVKNIYFPHWVMPEECLEIVRIEISIENDVVDGVPLESFKDIYSILTNV